jgi:hypothetical protein
MGCDRAKVVAVSVLQVVLQHIVTHWNDSRPIAAPPLCEQIAEILRSEFEELARQVAAERDNPCNDEE